MSLHRRPLAKYTVEIVGDRSERSCRELLCNSLRDLRTPYPARGPTCSKNTYYDQRVGRWACRQSMTLSWSTSVRELPLGRHSPVRNNRSEVPSMRPGEPVNTG